MENKLTDIGNALFTNPPVGELPQIERQVLPMNTNGVRVLPRQSAKITSRPQRAAFRPTHLFISGHSPEQTLPSLAVDATSKARWWHWFFPWKRVSKQLENLSLEIAQLKDAIVAFQLNPPRGAADWIVNDILIGNRSQFAQSGDIPGDLFASSAIDSFVIFETAQVAMDVTLVVTYVGPIKEGCEFYGSLVGDSVPLR